MKGRELQDGDFVYNTETQKIEKINVPDRNADYPDLKPIGIAVRTLIKKGFVPVLGKEYILNFPLPENKENDNITYFVSKTKIQNFNIRINGKKIMECKVNFIHEIQHILRHCGLYELAENFLTCSEI